MRINQSIFDVLVTKQLLDIENVFGSVILHSCFPMPEGMQRDPLESRIPELHYESLPRFAELRPNTIRLRTPDPLIRLRLTDQRQQYRLKFSGDLELPGV